MSVADTLVEFGIYGSYDLGIHNFLRDSLTPVEPTLIIIQSAPMRAFADAAAMLAKGLDNPALLENLEADLNRSANVPLPLVSVTPGAPTPRDNQRILPTWNLFRTSLPGTDPSVRERWVAKPPVPVWLAYQVELWTKTRSTMNALISALQLKFLPMAFGVADIDNWFWGSIWMPIHLDGMTDNSELESAEEDRLLRHTIAFRVEAWAFHPPEKDFTVHLTTLDEDPSHLENVYVKPLIRFSSLYFRSNAHRLFQVALARGKFNVIPVGLPPDPVTHYFGEKLLFFTEGLLLDQIAENGAVGSFLLNHSETGGAANLELRYSLSSLPSSPPLLIGPDQGLMIGDGGQFYTEVRLHRSLKLLYRTRYLPDTNLPPVPPRLPYEVLLPK